MLTNIQDKIWRNITEEFCKAQEQFHSNEEQDVVVDRIFITSAYAWALYTDLTQRGYQINFSPQLIENRDCEPSNPEFFNHLHSLEEFVTRITYLIDNGNNEQDDGINPT